MKSKQEIVGFAGVPEIGEGNPIGLLTAVTLLRAFGMDIFSENPNSLMIKLARLRHIQIANDPKAATKYAQNSSAQREGSLQTEVFAWELKRFVAQQLKLHAQAQFVITTQDMFAVAARKVVREIAKKTGQSGIPVIMPLQDAMGKFLRTSQPTEIQREIHYLPWNWRAFLEMKRLGLEKVTLIEPLNPLLAFNKLEEGELKKIGFSALFDSDFCVIKLSGSGGDAGLIKDAIKSLRKKATYMSFGLFSGQGKTQENILSGLDETTNKTIASSLNPEVFYNTTHAMQNEHLFLSYPSEQVGHMLKLSKLGTNLRVAWLPPKGQHEIENLIHYIEIASNQEKQTTICIRKKESNHLLSALIGAGFSPNLHFQCIEPHDLAPNHFIAVPSWQEEEEKRIKAHPNLHRITLEKAVVGILKGK